MNMSFNDQVVVITGAAGGLGAAMAHLFAENGAKVAVCDLRGADKVAEEITATAEQAKNLSDNNLKSAEEVKVAISTIQTTSEGMEKYF